MGVKTERPTGKDLEARDLEEEKHNENQMSVAFKTLLKKKNLLMSSYIFINWNVQNKAQKKTRAFHIQFSKYDNDVENQDSVKDLSVL